MIKSFVIKRSHIVLMVCIAVALLAVVLLVRTPSPTPAITVPIQERTIDLVTVEYKATTKDGKVIEAYRWDPGTIIVHKDEPITLRIHGINGVLHSFYIEGTDIKGEVKQGKETVIQFTPTKEGTYRLICQTHSDPNHNGPMIAYINVN
ncbi:hypothetical protein E0485_21145 [Paenibacillus albiflavus]|uniref:EfeO-type cupredoxin-like domain-containing protein n=1 Tax=Paenibacillus albiflavus TaxID=2545760 RepID=A0A4R4E1V6_9BACL|nr:cupredoxin domain-containing protein [Paenibacillus albiflavus]TCZ73416.1 hypothetical protein E0485_21145 [Paenibacillus albiflavus]